LAIACGWKEERMGRQGLREVVAVLGVGLKWRYAWVKQPSVKSDVADERRL
jgi:hypothetical protein